MNERLLNPISNAELDRRWAALRAAMAEQRRRRAGRAEQQ